MRFTFIVSNHMQWTLSPGKTHLSQLRPATRKPLNLATRRWCRTCKSYFIWNPFLLGWDLREDKCGANVVGTNLLCHFCSFLVKEDWDCGRHWKCWIFNIFFFVNAIIIFSFFNLYNSQVQLLLSFLLKFGNSTYYYFKATVPITVI